MNRSDATGRPRVGLAFIDPPGFDSDLFDSLCEAGIHATFFVRPDVLIQDSSRWRFAHAAGHELGVGCLLGVTDDGRLLNWSFEALDAEVRDAVRLLSDFGQTEVGCAYLPGHFQVCAGGRYRRRLQTEFRICLGETERSRSLDGVCGAFDSELPANARPSVIQISPDSASFHDFLSLAGDREIGVVRDIQVGNSHT